MSFLNFILFFAFICAPALGSTNSHDLPSWITSNPAFSNPEIIDSINPQNGSIGSSKKETRSWVIHLNDKLGYGVSIQVEKLSLDSYSDEYVMIAGWPIDTKKFKEVKLLTGKFTKTYSLIIPNTMSFFVLYNAASRSTAPNFEMTYKRYGTCYEKNPPTTESPIKKETMCEIQVKGKPLNEFVEAEFMKKFKEAIRTTAKNFCLDYKIPFNDTIPTEEMVFISRIGFCPFEWPDRDICVSLLHSVYVSGSRSADGFLLDFELTAEHLRTMWKQKSLPEIEKIGVTVFELPETSGVVLWWTFIVAAVMMFSLVGVCVFWSVQKISREIRFRYRSPTPEECEFKKRPKLKLAKHQKIPSFMLSTNHLETKKYEEAKSSTKDEFEDVSLGNQSGPLPIKNYIGGFLFGSNPAFEDDEDKVEFRKK